MLQEIRVTKMNDWSMNLEDAYYDDHPEELLKDALEAVQTTASGHFVNLVTPEGVGHPEQAFIPSLIARMQEDNIIVKDVRYIDECGCGGHVTRVSR
jgi:putative CGCGG family rSAM target protein